MERINRELLERVFENVRYRDGRGGKRFAYVEAHEVAKRLNDVFNSRYSFEVLSWQEMGTEVIVHGALSVTLDDGTVIKKHNVGSAEIRANRETGEVESYGDTVKSAVSDCLKRCAAFGFGVGLHLYFGEEQAPTHPPVAHSNNNTGPVNKLSQAQKNAIFAIGKAKGISSRALDEMASKNFGQPVETLSKGQASQFIQALQAYEQRQAG